jgi:hypothetical protein
VNAKTQPTPAPIALNVGPEMAEFLAWLLENYADAHEAAADRKRLPENVKRHLQSVANARGFAAAIRHRLKIWNTTGR